MNRPLRWRYFGRGDPSPTGDIILCRGGVSPPAVSVKWAVFRREQAPALRCDIINRRGDSRRLRRSARDIGEIGDIADRRDAGPYKGYWLPYGCNQPKASLV